MSKVVSTITDAIAVLEEIKKDHGDIQLHMEIGEDVACDACGESKYVMYSGMCKQIGKINVGGLVCAYLLADKD